MRVFQVFDSAPNMALHESRIWYRNLYEPLIDLGHEVFFFSAAAGAAAARSRDLSARARFSEKLVETFVLEHAKRPFDLLFCYLEDGMVDGQAIDTLRTYGVVACNFSCNNTHQFELAGRLARYFDYNLHSEADMGPRFTALGAKAIWWPMGANPKYYRPYPQERSIDVSFVGANYGLRARYAASLLDEGINLHCYGPTWVFGARSSRRAVVKRLLLLVQATFARNVKAQASASASLASHDFNRALWARHPMALHGIVSDDEVVQLYSRSKISLGILEVFDGNDPSRSILRHIHLREFEAPMCGALYCTGYLKELEEFYDLEKEIVIYRNEAELIEKARFYLSHPREAELIRQAAHRRALACHTCHERFRRLFVKIGMTGN